MKRGALTVAIVLAATIGSTGVLELSFGEAVAGPKTYAIEVDGALTVCTSIDPIRVPDLGEVGLWMLGVARNAPSVEPVPMVGTPRSEAFRVGLGDRIYSDGYMITLRMYSFADVDHVTVWVTGWCAELDKQ